MKAAQFARPPPIAAQSINQAPRVSLFDTRKIGPSNSGECFTVLAKQTKRPIE